MQAHFYPFSTIIEDTLTVVWVIMILLLFKDWAMPKINTKFVHIIVRSLRRTNFLHFRSIFIHTENRALIPRKKYSSYKTGRIIEKKTENVFTYYFQKSLFNLTENHTY